MTINYTIGTLTGTAIIYDTLVGDRVPDTNTTSFQDRERLQHTINDKDLSDRESKQSRLFKFLNQKTLKAQYNIALA